MFFYWAIWLGELFGVSLATYIFSSIWHTESGKPPPGAIRWDAFSFVFMAPVFATICNIVLLRFFGMKKVTAPPTVTAGPPGR